MFNLGFDKESPLCKKEHWVYIPSKECNYYRCGFYNNILKTNKLSMYIEIGYPKETIITHEMKDEQLKLTLKKLKDSGIVTENMNLIDYISIVMDPAYVHINTETDNKIKKLKNKLSKDNIYTIGRYGAWTYNSIEDNMIMSKDLAERLKGEIINEE